MSLNHVLLAISVFTMSVVLYSIVQALINKLVKSDDKAGDAE